MPPQPLQLSSVLLQQQQQTQIAQQQRQKQADCTYISGLSQEQLWSMAVWCMLVDPDKEDIAVLEHTLKAGSFTIPDLKLFEVYLCAWAKVEAELTDFYNETMCWQQVGATMPMVPLHWKLQLSACINCQRANQLLMNWLKKRFTQDTGWQTLLKRASFTVYLIDKYLTSKTCPICKKHISMFHKVKNLRPWMRTNCPMVKCHGLLGCQSQTCMEFFDTYQRGYLGKEEGEKKDNKEDEKKGSVKWQLWNWDLAAVLNFRKILFSLRETGTVPSCFQRKQPTDASKTTTRKATARKTTAPAAPAPNPN
ncbi:hypothetical protein GGH96_005412 [Coemansia sp. RSA 1972]|nr:hypothetical protein GGH96_005412 [Coemansia sp. RSA 1972]